MIMLLIFWFGFIFTKTGTPDNVYVPVVHLGIGMEISLYYESFVGKIDKCVMYTEQGFYTDKVYRAIIHFCLTN